METSNRSKLEQNDIQISIGTKMANNGPLIPLEKIELLILYIRSQKVMLDSDLADLYRVETKALNQAVRRNINRFPSDFMFRLTKEELKTLRSQFVTSDRFAGRRYPPYAFTEQGVAMLSSVLNSPRAIQVNIEIMRAFVQLRQMLASNEELSRKLDELESKYDAQFDIVFKAIRQLMLPPETEHRKMGFQVENCEE